MRKQERTYVTGFPRIGAGRELKKALERYWSGKNGIEKVIETGRDIRKTAWENQKRAGIDFYSCGDFSFYDGMLDTAVMLGTIPELSLIHI